MKRNLLLVFFCISLVLLFSALFYEDDAYRGEKSDHFDGRHFFNHSKHVSRQYYAAFQGVFLGQQTLGQWKLRENKKFPMAYPRVYGSELKVTFVNHATVLIQTQGLNILTDPIWSEYAGPLPYLSPYRYRPPGILFEHLPEIDLVVVSHSHYDHMDLPTLKRLSDRFKPKIFVGLGNASLLIEYGIQNVSELDWWSEEELVQGFSIVGVPAQHWSRRTVGDKNMRLWMGYLFKTVRGNIYFAGDTASGKHFEIIRKRLGDIRLALLPIGAFRPEAVMQGSHMSPVQAVDAHLILQARTSVAIHFGTFRLGLDGQDEALNLLTAALARKSRNGEVLDFRALDFGESTILPLY
ncbi:MAG: MBL fold metallo-hydrolase [Gammaproteobacteria bacterium]|nr:MBL fold metallo-hydrolase [Gammaproteobacteria bacterium]